MACFSPDHGGTGPDLSSSFFFRVTPRPPDPPPPTPHPPPPQPEPTSVQVGLCAAARGDAEAEGWDPGCGGGAGALACPEGGREGWTGDGWEEGGGEGRAVLPLLMRDVLAHRLERLPAPRNGARGWTGWQQDVIRPCGTWSDHEGRGPTIKWSYDVVRRTRDGWGEGGANLATTLLPTMAWIATWGVRCVGCGVCLCVVRV
jgi:hypothetical protein